MALGCDGDALDRGRYAGSSQRLPKTEGSQAGFQHYVLHWRLTKSKTHMATLFAMPTPLNINLGSDRFAMFNK